MRGWMIREEAVGEVAEDLELSLMEKKDDFVELVKLSLSDHITDEQYMALDKVIERKEEELSGFGVPADEVAELYKRAEREQ